LVTLTTRSLEVAACAETAKAQNSPRRKVIGLGKDLVFIDSMIGWAIAYSSRRFDWDAIHLA